MNNIFFEKKEKYAKLSINNLEKKNALTNEMYKNLATYINEVSEDKEISVLIIQSAGQDFTSGNDVNEFLSNPEPSESSPIWDFVRAILDFKKVLILAVNGNCIGIGTTMIMHADFVYASPDSKFCMPFLNIGLVPEFGSTITFPNEIGRKRASELLILGKPFNAQDALKMSIINEVCEDPKNKAEEIAKEICGHPSWALEETKRLLLETYNKNMISAVRNEYFSFKKALSSDPVKVFFQNFIKKNKMI